jgi:hypothetical protein
MLSFGIKINIMLFLISVLVALYLFVMQKEIKLMQNDINELRSTIKDMVKNSCPKPVVVVDDDEEEEDIKDIEDTVKDDDVAEDVQQILTTMSALEEEVQEKQDDKTEEEEDDHIIKISTKAKRIKKTKTTDS